MRIDHLTQKGFSAIMAVVMILLLALLGGYMATLTTIGSLNTTQSLSAVQAWFAARSGVEWGAYQVLNNQSCIGFPGALINPAGGAVNFNVTVTCTLNNGGGAVASIDEGAGPPPAPIVNPYNVYAITATATRNNLGDVTYASRTINVSLFDRNAP
ncbi:MAG: hypothetical protein O7D86_05345 [Proteobacteria bacterium]|nr:hypothetical protein [Pseudomonadota bacterium]